MKPRREVLEFSGAMEYKLALNDIRGGWLECDPFWLLRRLREETTELEKVMRSKGDGWLTKLTLEAADVANFAMMIQDAMTHQWAGKIDERAIPKEF